MKQDLLRAQMFAKRRIARALNYSPGSSISLDRHEKSSTVLNERIEMYSNSSTVEIHDPRSELPRGHYFQQRFAYHAQDVILEPKQGLLYSAEGALVEESTNWPIFQMYDSFPWNPKANVKTLEIESAIFLPSSAFWHWLIEDLPPTIFALGLDFNSPILVAMDPPKYVRDFLATLDREVIFLDGPVKVNSVTFVGKGQDSGWPHPKDLDVVQSYDPFAQARHVSSAPEKIYISRRASRRSPSNEVEIEELFLSRGFRVVRLEEMNLLDEIRLVSGVSFIAGVHGAGMTNMIWMPPESKLFDIANDDYWTESPHRAAHMLGIEYDYSIYKGELTGAVSIVEIARKLDSFNR